MSDQKPQLSHSMFTMWRCIVALAHADGQLSQPELDYFEKLFENLRRFFDLSQEQRDTFANDLYVPQETLKLFSSINDPEARGMLVGFAEELAWIDNHLDPHEEEILRRLRMEGLSLSERERLRADIRADIDMHKQEWTQERAALRGRARDRNPFFHAADLILMKLGIDILD